MQQTAMIGYNYLKIFALTNFPTGNNDAKSFTKYCDKFLIWTRPTILCVRLNKKKINGYKEAVHYSNFQFFKIIPFAAVNSGHYRVSMCTKVRLRRDRHTYTRAIKMSPGEVKPMFCMKTHLDVLFTLSFSERNKKPNWTRNTVLRHIN